MPAWRHRSYGYVIAASAFACYLLLGGSYYSLSVLAPLMAADLGWSATAFGAAFSIFALLLGLSSPLAGAFVVRFGPRLAILIGSLIVSVALAFLSTATALWQFYALTTLLGLGFGMGGTVSMQQLIGNWFFQRRSLLMGFVLTGAGLGGLIFAPLTGSLAVGLGSWRPVWLILAALLLLPGLLALLVIKDDPEGQRRRAESPGAAPDPKRGNPAHAQKDGVHRSVRSWETAAAVRSRAFWLLSLTWGIMGFLLQGVTGHQVAYLANEAQVDLTIAASALGLIAGSSIVGRLVSGWLGDRVEPARVTAGLLACMSLGLAVLVAAGGLFGTYLYVVLFGIGYGGVIVLMPTIILNYYGAQRSAAIMGVAMLLHTGLGAAGGSVVGHIKDVVGSYVPAFVLMIGLGAAGALSALLARPPVVQNEGARASTADS